MTSQPMAIADAYVAATNAHDAAAFAALFAEDALIDDNGRKLSGRDAIKAWSESDIFSVDVTLTVLDQIEDNGDALITTKVDGTFDRTGLPDPVIITHRLAISDNKITALTCRLASNPQLTTAP